MNSYTRELVDQLYEDRLATLLSVQDMVEAIVDALEVREGGRSRRGGEEGGKRNGRAMKWWESEEQEEEEEEA